MTTWTEVKQWLNEKPYDSKHTDTIIRHLRLGTAWQWEPFEKFFTGGPSKSVALAALRFKEEFIAGTAYYVTRWCISDSSKIGIASGPSRYYTTKHNIPSIIGLILMSAKAFFPTMGEIQGWSKRCVICGNTDMGHAWYVPTAAPAGSHVATPKFQLRQCFQISSERYDQIATEFGWDTRECGMVGICTKCPSDCLKCGLAISSAFDIQEMREFLVSKECLTCSKYNLAKVEYPKPSRNTWKEIARRKDLTP